MKKVKVQRYISGKRPEYAAQFDSSGEESDEEDFVGGRHKAETLEVPSSKPDIYDPRLKRLAGRERDEYEEDRHERHRIIHEPTHVLDSEEEESDNSEKSQVSTNYQQRVRRISLDNSDSAEDDVDLSDSEIERRRLMLRQKALQKKQDEELLAKGTVVKICFNFILF